MIELELRQIVDAIRIPLSVTDNHGTVLAENRAWASVRQMLGEEAQGLQNLLEKAIESKTEQSLKACGLTVLASPLENGYIVLQLKGEDLQKLREQMEDTMQTNSAYQETLSNFGIQNCIATSDSMIRIFTKAKQVAAYPTTILLLGETGVGKEVVSSFIHHNSDRADKPFIKINCSAIPEPLMESELFGYEKGAFTGAREKGKMGLFELANHGTILLDEIGDMSLPLQAKLLRTIQENEIMRVGGTHPIKLDVRLISATSRNIEEMVASGKFLDALYYRLNVVELQIPPLRKRQEDIIPLAEFYLQHFCEKYKLTKEFAPDVRSCFLQYGWPGNVRELRNTVENLTVSSIGTWIVREDLPTRIAGRDSIVAHSHVHSGETSMKAAVEALQRDLVSEAIHRQGSLRKAAAALDMDPTTLGRLAKKLGVELS
ncbi:sigma-54 interaction domain-containing protein [Dysosmobacter sp.]|uniref:sigma-54 interaction domain-containing protein n=1 Tax=Dysosmobacter sp. TaxID=2591382 RepID=UPI003A90116B